MHHCIGPRLSRLLPQAPLVMTVSTRSSLQDQAGSININVGSSSAGPRGHIKSNLAQLPMRIKPAGQLPFKQDKVLAVESLSLSTDEDYPKAGGQVSVTGGSSTTGVGGTVSIAGGSTEQGVGGSLQLVSGFSNSQFQ